MAAGRISVYPPPMKALLWTARILAAAILVFGLPFYFGYGNPLPFANPENSGLDNLWLGIFPLVFLGLAAGWRWPRLGGAVVVVAIAVGQLAPMLAPLIPGLLYLFGRAPGKIISR